MPIDQRFTFEAVNPCNDKRYTEEDAVLFPAYDPSLVLALLAYKDGCIEQAVEADHVNSIRLLLSRVVLFQNSKEYDRPQSTVIDRKFIIKGKDITTGEQYDETNAIVMCAKDVIFPIMLKEYCRFKTENQYYPDLLQRVLEFQEKYGHKVPDTTGECEIARCIHGQGI